MTMGLKSLLGMCLLTCGAFSAQGAAVYEFEGTYIDFSTQQVIGPVTFSLSLPGPVSPTATFLESAPELTCSDCSFVTFYSVGTFALDFVTVGYGFASSEYFFYFDPASFTQPGTYDSQLLDGTNDGVLTTRITGGNPDPDPGTVPEPGTLALLGFGLAGLTMARRRRG